MAPHLNDIRFVVNNGAGRPMFRQHQPVRFSLHVQPGSALDRSLREFHPAFGTAAFAQGRRRGDGRRQHGIDFLASLHLMKGLGKRDGGFRWTEYQEARRLEGVMHDRQNFALQCGPKVDQHVAATDEIQPRERRVLRYVMPGENTRVPNDLRNLISAFRSGEEPRQPLRRDVRQRGVRVGAGPRLFDRRSADIGGENLDGKAHSPFAQEFHQANGDRVRLLPSGAARHPDADGIFELPILNQRGEHDRLEFLEDRRFPKERCDGDQTALAQRVGFLAILFQIPAVIFQPFESAEGHAALDAPRQRAVLVVREVHSGGVPHQPEDLGQVRIARGLNRIQSLAGEVRPCQFHQSPRDSGRRQDKIHDAAGDGAFRHPVALRGSDFLCEGGTARGLDRLQAQRPIGCVSR